MGFFVKKDEEPQAEETQEERKTYVWVYECINCGEENTLAIPLGTTIHAHTISESCKECGCKIKV